MILMIYQSENLKEFILPNINNADYNILIDKTVFIIKKSINLTLEVINNQWLVKSAPLKEYRLIYQNNICDKVSICGGEIITINANNGDSLKCIVLSGSLSLVSFKKYDLRNIDFLSIGSGENNDIRYDFNKLVSKNHCSIIRTDRKIMLNDSSANGVFVNNKRVYGRIELNYGDEIEIFGLKILCFSEIIAINSQFGGFEVTEKLPEYTVLKQNVQNSIQYSQHEIKYFNRSPRIFQNIATDLIAIEPPAAPKFSKKKSLLETIGPSFTMAIPMLLGCGLMIFSSLSSGSIMSTFLFTGVITSVGSATTGAIWAMYSIRSSKRAEAEEENQRFNAYGNYLLEIAELVRDKYIQNYNALHKMYPSAQDCCKFSSTSPELWCKNNSHNDFMFYRLGVGDIDFQLDIQIPKEKFTMTYDNLSSKPAELYENYKKLRDVPVGINLKDSNLYGIVGGENKRGVFAVVNNLIAQIISGNCYTDVKIAFCFDSSKLNNKDCWDYVKWTPHVWSENKKIRYYATNVQESCDVFFELSNILRVRSESLNTYGNKTPCLPHYILFVSDLELLDGEIINKYIFDTKVDYGLTTFIMSDYHYNLPNACEWIIENDAEFCGCYNVKQADGKVEKIIYDELSVDSLTSFAKSLSNISVKEIETDNTLPNSIDFFEMYGIRSLTELNVIEQWRKNRTYVSMRALIGKKAGGDNCYLDIHEKFHGPHGLVAGTTGSGKSEIIQTFVLSLALSFSPDDVAFFMIDFKGGGMADLFSDLPHLAGQISNLSGNQIGRAMISIKSENLRRQKIFRDYGVNNINNYTRLFKSGEAAEPIPHLIIIIDEFAELKKEEPDFMRELISVAQVGRSLGVHLILATQKPSGTVDDNIWSNAKFRLCLRVQDRQDSNDMLHKPDAAYITQAGRAYLQVGNDEIYELFQSGWSGAPYDNNDYGKNEIATIITPTGKTAVVGSHTKKMRKEYERKKWYSYLLKSINEILSYEAISTGKDNALLSEDISLSKRVIEKAQKDGLNIGASNSDISAVGNFIRLMFLQNSASNNTVEQIIAKADSQNIKLPELKEKTQLEAVVEYLKGIANNNGYVKKARLWMPLLKKSILLSSLSGFLEYSSSASWENYGEYSLNALVGLIDDPENQSQMPFSIDFVSGGHLCVCGSVVSGKSTFLQTLIYSLSVKYSPDYLNFYLIDFSSTALKAFEQLPHCGGIMFENDLDKIDKFFTMLESIIDERKRLLGGGNYNQYVKVNGCVVPAVIIVIDNYSAFKEKTENVHEEKLIRLSRDGVRYGIYLVFSSAGFGLSEIPNRIGDNIKTVVSLEMSDKFKYMDVLRISHINVIPESGIKGRGVAIVDGRLLEFQTALALNDEDDYKRSSMISSVCKQMKNDWKGETARNIPFIPPQPHFEQLHSLPQYIEKIKTGRFLPFAYNFKDASVYGVDLSDVYCYTISGKKRTGKTNTLKLLMYAAFENGAKSVVIERDSNELKGLSEQFGFKYLDSDRGVFEYFNNITSTFVERNKKKHSFYEQGLSDYEIYEKMSEFEPIFIFIANVADFIDEVYHPNDGIKNMSAFFENIIEKGFLHNIFFFGCVNTDKASELSGYKMYQLFVSYKKGVHLGGNVSAQRIFSFQNIHYSQMSKSSKKGEGLVPSTDDDSIAEKIIIPLYGGQSK